MEITRELIGKKVKTPRGEGLVMGRIIEFGRATKVVVQIEGTRQENPRLVDAFPASDVELVDAMGDVIRDLPGR